MAPPARRVTLGAARGGLLLYVIKHIGCGDSARGVGWGARERAQLRRGDKVGRLILRWARGAKRSSCNASLQQQQCPGRRKLREREKPTPCQTLSLSLFLYFHLGASFARAPRAANTRYHVPCVRSTVGSSSLCWCLGEKKKREVEALSLCVLSFSRFESVIN